MIETLLTLSIAEAAEMSKTLTAIGLQQINQYKPDLNRREFAIVQAQIVNAKIEEAEKSGAGEISLKLDEDQVPNLNRALADTKNLGGDVALSALVFRELVANAMRGAEARERIANMPTSSPANSFARTR